MESNNRISRQPMIPDFEQMPDGSEVQFYLVPMIEGSIVCLRDTDVSGTLKYLEPICWLDRGYKLSPDILREHWNE